MSSHLASRGFAPEDYDIIYDHYTVPIQRSGKRDKPDGLAIFYFGNMFKLFFRQIKRFSENIIQHKDRERHLYIFDKMIFSFKGFVIFFSILNLNYN